MDPEIRKIQDSAGIKFFGDETIVDEMEFRINRIEVQMESTEPSNYTDEHQKVFKEMFDLVERIEQYFRYFRQDVKEGKNGEAAVMFFKAVEDMKKLQELWNARPVKNHKGSVIVNIFCGSDGKKSFKILIRDFQKILNADGLDAYYNKHKDVVDEYR